MMTQYTASKSLKILACASLFLVFSSNCLAERALDEKLMTAINEGNSASVIKLIDNGAKIDKNKAGQVLVMLTLSMKTKIIDYLLSKNAVNVNATDGWGSTALTTAIQAGKIDVLKVLIKHKVNVNKKDNSGVTPLKLAEQYGGSIVTLLKNAGAQ